MCPNHIFPGHSVPWVATFVKYSLCTICFGALRPSGLLIPAWQNPQLDSSILAKFLWQEATLWTPVLTWTDDKEGQIAHCSCQYESSMKHWNLKASYLAKAPGSGVCFPNSQCALLFLVLPWALSPYTAWQLIKANNALVTEAIKLNNWCLESFWKSLERWPL
jgi:hypothetical protein